MWWASFRPPRTAAYAARHGLFLHRCSQDVLAVYEKPYDPAESVVYLDEKPIFLHTEVRPPRPAAPGHTAMRDNQYKRCGTATRPHGPSAWSGTT